MASALARWEGRGAVARYGTRRGLLWSVFIALAFFELTNPTHLVPDFPGAMGVLAVVTGLVLLLDRRNVRLPRVPWTIAAYIALCALSVFWSIDRSDTVQMTLLYGWIALFACLCVAQTDTQTLLRGVAWGGVVVLAVTLGSVVVDPMRFGGGLVHYGTGPGVHGTRGIVAYSMILALSAALARRDTRTSGKVEIGVTIALNLSLVVIAPAATGRVGVPVLLVGLLALVIMRRLHGKALLGAWAVILLVIVVGAVAAVLNTSRIAAAFGRTPDFSGRFAIWQAIIPTWLEAPVGGYGFGAVWYYGWWRLDGSALLDHMNEVAKTPFYHGHNILIDVLPQLGALGLVAALLILGLLAFRGIRDARDTTGGSTWAVLALITLLVMGITEPMLSVPIGWFCAVAATAAARRRGPTA